MPVSTEDLPLSGRGPRLRHRRSGGLAEIRPIPLLIVLLVWGGVGLGACATPTEPEMKQYLGVLTWDGAEPPVSLAVTGRQVEVSFHTWGSSCNEAGETHAAVLRMRATITPYDRAPPVGTACPLDLRPLEHRVVVEFPDPGRGVISLRGLSTAGDEPGGELVEYEYPVELE